MADLVRWLGEQLDEDERIARAATDGPWAVNDDTYAESISAANGTEVVAGGRWGGEASVFDSTEDALHIAEWDPARVLREIDAKRQIIRLHEITVEKTRVTPFDPYTGERNPDEYDVTCAICGWASDDPTSGCLTLRALALPYADRPGFRAEWAPTT